jgi:hypothetical protein
MLNVAGAEETRKFQELALKSRLRIPLLFGQDVIHGYRTTFPVNLGQAASWDLKLIEKSERIAATEASAYGIHWTFAPMVDIARDPRWGRVMEGSGKILIWEHRSVLPESEVFREKVLEIWMRLWLVQNILQRMAQWAEETTILLIWFKTIERKPIFLLSKQRLKPGSNFHELF